MPLPRFRSRQWGRRHDRIHACSALHAPANRYGGVRSRPLGLCLRRRRRGRPLHLASVSVVRPVRCRLIAAYALACGRWPMLATGPGRFTRPSFGSARTLRPDGHQRIEGSRCRAGGSSPWPPTHARSPRSGTRLASCSTRQSLQAHGRRCGWDATLQLDPVEARRGEQAVLCQRRRLCGAPNSPMPAVNDDAEHAASATVAKP